jgi:pyruvate/oxaloacetate carboxyltransferase
LREAEPGHFYLDEPSWTALRALRQRMALMLLLLVLGLGLVFYLKRSS